MSLVCLGCVENQRQMRRKLSKVLDLISSNTASKHKLWLQEEERHGRGHLLSMGDNKRPLCQEWREQRCLMMGAKQKHPCSLHSHPLARRTIYFVCIPLLLPPT